MSQKEIVITRYKSKIKLHMLRLFPCYVVLIALTISVLKETTVTSVAYKTFAIIIVSTITSMDLTRIILSVSKELKNAGDNINEK